MRHGGQILVDALEIQGVKRVFSVPGESFLAALDGSCETPIAGLATLDGGTLRLRGEILRTDGSEALGDDVSGPVEDGAEMGRAMAAGLLERAGDGFFGWT